jgi:hypothetical protein
VILFGGPGVVSAAVKLKPVSFGTEAITNMPHTITQQVTIN